MTVAARFEVIDEWLIYTIESRVYRTDPREPGEAYAQRPHIC
jgi:hypothetical protein